MYDLKTFMIDNPWRKTVLILAAGTRVRIIIIIIYALIRESYPSVVKKVGYFYLTHVYARKSLTLGSNDLSVDRFFKYQFLIASSASLHP